MAVFTTSMRGATLVIVTCTVSVDTPPIEVDVSVPVQRCDVLRRRHGRIADIQVVGKLGGDAHRDGDHGDHVVAGEHRLADREAGVVHGDGDLGPAVAEATAILRSDDRKLRVPLFLNEGEVIRVDTRTGDYISRGKGD